MAYKYTFFQSSGMCSPPKSINPKVSLVPNSTLFKIARCWISLSQLLNEFDLIRTRKAAILCTAVNQICDFGIPDVAAAGTSRQTFGAMGLNFLRQQKTPPQSYGLCIGTGP